MVKAIVGIRLAPRSNMTLVNHGLIDTALVRDCAKDQNKIRVTHGTIQIFSSLVCQKKESARPAKKIFKYTRFLLVLSAVSRSPDKDNNRRAG